MLVAVGFGSLFWLLDALWDYLLFTEDLREVIYSEPLNFMDSLIVDIPRHEIWVRSAFMVSCLVGGGLVAIYVNRLHRLTDALEQREADLANAQRLAGVGNWTLELPSQKITWSAEMYRIFDRDPAKGPLTHEERIRCIHEDDRQHYRDAVEPALKAGEGYRVEFRIKTQDGSTRYLQALGEAECDRYGQPVRIFGTTQDLTDRRRSEERIEESERTWRTLMQSIQAGVAVHSADTTLITCNSRLCEFFGLSEEQMLGKDAGFHWNLLREDGTAMPLDQYPVKQVLKTQKPVRSMIIGIESGYRPDITWLLVNADPVFDAEGKLDKIIVTSADITDRREADEHRRDLEVQIQHAQKLESLGVLAGGIAHDFNNLLVGVLGNADLALTELSPVSPARQSVKEIEVAARRAAELCRQMLAYSGKGRFVVEPVQLSEIVEEMGHMLEVAISKKVVLKYNFAENLPAVNVDVTQIRQVVMNLITNASEAIGERSGMISLTTGALECDEEYLRETFIVDDIPPGLYVTLEVADTGCGMDEETRSKLFDPFYTTKFTGRGLGLAAVLGIVRGHGGAIKVYSEPERGSTFKILLPACGEEAAPRIDVNGETGHWKGKGTILLADDEETIRAVGRRMLELLGFNVITAFDGHNAVELYREHRDNISAVILDLTMPRLDGEETYRALRQEGIKVPVILSSGYNEQEVTERFLGKGTAGFIQKPYHVEEMKTVLRSAFRTNDSTDKNPTPTEDA
jgi:PAS domain S-box-containing protein